MQLARQAMEPDPPDLESYNPAWRQAHNASRMRALHQARRLVEAGWRPSSFATEPGQPHCAFCGLLLIDPVEKVKNSEAELGLYGHLRRIENKINTLMERNHGQTQDHRTETVLNALAHLVQLKDGPRDGYYELNKDAAWNQARWALRMVTG